jgi:hypothetical protein
MEGRKKCSKVNELYPFMERAFKGNTVKFTQWFNTDQQPGWLSADRTQRSLLTMTKYGKWPYFEGKQLFRKYKEFLKIHFRDFLPLWQECLVGKKVPSITDLPSGPTLEDM